MTTSSLNKIYFVSVNIRLGEYEKSVETFREAASKGDAEYDALCGETHNTALTREEYDRGTEWWDDYMVYSASAYEVPAELALTLQKFNQHPLSLIK
ncbi:hypothetical protein NB550_11375 [Vibrio parahaemolyticus]|uniref:hypothetical protein n=1 Tax=Vibrio TaxID=662 RepID=UPI0015D3E001|nr:hypothetical protein [Vibrio parahaemolyticus]MCR9888161.1 hypothetical protein [Vibrio parahaemolyticus]MCR9918091.1 hypothetical protein [Vibrio parahaemolyticus]NYU23811.1 hypothetical protein [Vibrio parahaemolyticus]WHT06019.1 hypothetical protein O2T11_25565 [Vibrio parahaemolyticus]